MDKSILDMKVGEGVIMTATTDDNGAEILEVCFKGWLPPNTVLTFVNPTKADIKKYGGWDKACKGTEAVLIKVLVSTEDDKIN